MPIADELSQLALRQPAPRREILSLDLDSFEKAPGGINALAIQRSGGKRSYCATFQFNGLEAVVSYAGVGIGLEGERVGKVEYGTLWSLMELLAEQGETLKGSYENAIEIFCIDEWLRTAYLLIQRDEERHLVHSWEGAGPPLLRVSLNLLDMLLDHAVWERQPFTIKRDLPDSNPFCESSFDKP